MEMQKRRKGKARYVSGLETGQHRRAFAIQSADIDTLQVKITQRGIRHVLTERWYAYENARRLAQSQGIDLAKDSKSNEYMASDDVSKTIASYLMQC